MIRSKLLSGVALGLCLGFSTSIARAQATTSTSSTSQADTGTPASAKAGIAAAEAVLDGQTIDKASPDQLHKIRHILDKIVTQFPASDAATHILLEDKVGKIDVGALDRRLSQIVINEAGTGTASNGSSTPTGTASASATEASPPATGSTPSSSAPSSSSGSATITAAAPAPAPQPGSSTSAAQSGSSASIAQSGSSDQTVQAPTFSQTATRCEQLAASPQNPDNPPGIQGVPDGKMDAARAVAACRAAVAAFPGNTYLRFNLANALSNSKSTSDQKEAWNIGQGLASQGYPMAMAAVGAMYVIGDSKIGAERDPRQAHTFLVRAAGRGIPFAYYMLGQTYANGLGVKKDFAIAIGLYLKAATARSSVAEYVLGASYAEGGGGVAKNTAMANYWLHRSIDDGSPMAANLLGLYLEAGLHGFQKNYAEAFKYLSLADQRGNFSSKVNLAYLYAHGLGTQRDPQKAAHLIYDTLAAGPSDKRLAGKNTTRSIAKGVAKSLGRQFPKDTIRALQGLLAQSGFYQGALDGLSGPGTNKAIGDLCLCNS